jgi:hypothetical protein
MGHIYYTSIGAHHTHTAHTHSIHSTAQHSTHTYTAHTHSTHSTHTYTLYIYIAYTHTVHIAYTQHIPYHYSTLLHRYAFLYKGYIRIYCAVCIHTLHYTSYCAIESHNTEYHIIRYK